jgi:hypothetical protein
MALVRQFNKGQMNRNSLHDEIDTFGRTTREMPGKKSQTIQLDREGAEALYHIIGESFQLK